MSIVKAIVNVILTILFCSDLALLLIILVCACILNMFFFTLRTSTRKPKKVRKLHQPLFIISNGQQTSSANKRSNLHTLCCAQDLAEIKNKAFLFLPISNLPNSVDLLFSRN